MPETLVANIKIKAKNTKPTENGEKMSFLGQDGNWYSAFKTSCDDETWEYLDALKKGDIIKFPYILKGQWRNMVGKPEKGDGGVAEETSQRQDNGGDKMTKEDWARKDDRIAWESIFSSLCILLSGGATSPQDVISYADEVFDHLKEKLG